MQSHYYIKKSKLFMRKRRDKFFMMEEETDSGKTHTLKSIKYVQKFDMCKWECMFMLMDCYN